MKHYENGVEYITRTQLVNQYNIPATCLQRVLEKSDLDKVVDGTTFYFIKTEVEPLVTNWLTSYKPRKNKPNL